MTTRPRTRLLIETGNVALAAIAAALVLPGVHGVLVVPALHRVYATATAASQMATIDEDTGRILHRTPTRNYPDGLAVTRRVPLPGCDHDHGLTLDPLARRLYVAAESGDLTILDNHAGHLTVTGRAHLADGAHVVAVDPATHDSYYPIPDGPGGHPALLAYQPAS